MKKRSVNKVKVYVVSVLLACFIQTVHAYEWIKYDSANTYHGVCDGYKGSFTGRVSDGWHYVAGPNLRSGSGMSQSKAIDEACGD